MWDSELLSRTSCRSERCVSRFALSSMQARWDYGFERSPAIKETFAPKPEYEFSSCRPFFAP